MQINFSELKGRYIYEKNQPEPWGRVKDIVLSEDSNLVDAITVETLSLIPLCRTFSRDKIRLASHGRIYVEKTQSGKNENPSSVSVGEIRGIYHEGDFSKRLKNVCFDTETGEISDIVVEKGLLRKRNKITINKMKIKDNTIYIE